MCVIQSHTEKCILTHLNKSCVFIVFFNGFGSKAASANNFYLLLREEDSSCSLQVAVTDGRGSTFDLKTFHATINASPVFEFSSSVTKYTTFYYKSLSSVTCEIAAEKNSIYNPTKCPFFSLQSATGATLLVCCFYGYLISFQSCWSIQFCTSNNLISEMFTSSYSLSLSIIPFSSIENFYQFSETCLPSISLVMRCLIWLIKKLTFYTTFGLP
ncbi:hypothetical protein EGR_08249 [Echinococcus granulosus]|uniref:Uncharacterized protein n=1 Tax=Echinococcus granulosus TaxID=6210 RepID=W6UFH9_ECHGR|nr:hypothetical protein EGR_08249 [Echinococcus granulosus]EUB56897.1 hypothetical protein EGR_08249 [Echinococcus granulosus]